MSATPPPRRRSTPGAGPATVAPTRRPTVGAPPRIPGSRPPRARTSYRQRRLVALALVLTVLVVGAYGVKVLIDRIGGTTTTEVAAPPQGTGYVPAVQRAILAAFGTLQTGIDMRSLSDQYNVRNRMDQSIAVVRQSRDQLLALQPEVKGERATILQTTIDDLDQLDTALTDWRNAVFNLRLATVQTSRTAAEAAGTAVGQQLEAWKALG